MKQVIYSLVTIILALLIYLSINISIENTAREQNNFNLDSVEYCVNEYMKDSSYSTDNFTKSLNECARAQRSMGITGDIFVIRKDDKKLFWNSSEDCKPNSNKKLYMTKEGGCSLFKDPDSCVKSTDYMVTHEPKGILEWNFDGSEEFIDYRYITIENKKYIIAQGAQSDEANSKFVSTYVALAFGTIVMILLSVF